MDRESVILQFLIGFAAIIAIFWIPASLSAISWCLLIIAPLAIARGIYILFRTEGNKEQKKLFDN